MEEVRTWQETCSGIPWTLGSNLFGNGSWLEKNGSCLLPGEVKTSGMKR